MVNNTDEKLNTNCEIIEGGNNTSYDNNVVENVSNLSSSNLNDKKNSKKLIIFIIVIISIFAILFFGYNYFSVNDDNDDLILDHEEEVELVSDLTLQLTMEIEEVLVNQNIYSFSSLYVNSETNLVREVGKEKWMDVNENTIEELNIEDSNSHGLYLIEIFLLSTLENPKDDWDSLANINSIPSVGFIFPNENDSYYLNDYNYIFIADMKDENMDKYLEAWAKWHQGMNVDEADPYSDFVKVKSIENAQMYTIGTTVLFIMHPQSSMIVKSLEKKHDLVNHTYMLNSSNHDGLLEELDVFLYNEICKWHIESVANELEINSSTSFSMDPDFILSDINLLDEYTRESFYDLLDFKEGIFVSNDLSTLSIFQLEEGESHFEIIDEILALYANIGSDFEVVVDSLSDDIIYILVYATVDSPYSYKTPSPSATILKEIIEKFQTNY